jgi:hypothetical protein
MVVDLYPEAPGTATAAKNLGRCWIGAAAVAGVGALLNCVGKGWFDMLVVRVWVGFSPVLWLHIGGFRGGERRGGLGI